MINTTPPVAKKVPVTRTHHGDVFTDSFEWLRDKENPEVKAHLEAEQAYTDAVTADQEPLRQAIFDEIKSRTQETDLSVPSRKDGWWYYTRTEEGKAYGVHCRVQAADTGNPVEDWTPPVIEAGAPTPGEQVLLDGNAEAEGKPFFSLGGAAVTRDGNLYAYAQDNSGDELFTVRIKDLRHAGQNTAGENTAGENGGELLDDVIENVFYGLVFAPDGSRLFYMLADDSWRPYQVKSHVLGTPVADDEVLYQEDDVAMWTGFELSADRRALVISIGCSEYSESRVLHFDDPGASLQMVIPREENILYDAEPFLLDGAEKILLTHNRDAVNSMISLLDVAELDKPVAEQRWAAVVEHDDDVRVNGATVTATHMVLSIRADTIERVQVIELAGLGTPAQAPAVEPAFEEALYTTNMGGSDYDAPVIRLGYTSYLTPPRIYDYALPLNGSGPGNGTGGGLLLRKESPVLGGYSSTDYVAEREWARAPDGTRVPLSVIRRADLPRNGSNAGVVYGYGSYEMSMDPAFSIARLSLLDRGIVFVVAHIRGGGEMGRHWYEQGKKTNKKNTFTDFIAGTDWLAGSGWVDPKRIAAIGGSAGGLLMGAVANLAPEKYAAVVAQVPFVDALTTILDPELPLSALEWEEWGNPITDAEVYHYMKDYTPYENIRPVAYPRIAAVTSFNDTRVLYVEPAKWVQALRETTTGSEPIVLKIEMDGGHGGASGRYEGWKTRAWDYAFVADALGATKLLG